MHLFQLEIITINFHAFHITKNSTLLCDVTVTLIRQDKIGNIIFLKQHICFLKNIYINYFYSKMHTAARISTKQPTLQWAPGFFTIFIQQHLSQYTVSSNISKFIILYISEKRAKLTKQIHITHNFLTLISYNDVILCDCRNQKPMGHNAHLSEQL